MTDYDASHTTLSGIYETSKQSKTVSSTHTRFTPPNESSPTTLSEPFLFSVLGFTKRVAAAAPASPSGEKQKTEKQQAGPSSTQVGGWSCLLIL
jgi:hypothetical protein